MARGFGVRHKGIDRVMRAKSGNLDQTNVRQHRKRDNSRKIGNS